jgi:predicted ester cyclase
VGGVYTSPIQNKATFRRLVDEVWNRGNMTIADEIYHPQATYPSNPSLPIGSQGVKTSVGLYRQAMPDFHAEFKNLLTDGDMVLAWLSQSGTHSGSLMGIPATGKKTTWGQIIIARFAGGQIVESWSNEDVLGLFQQLGVGGSTSSGA